MTWFVFALLTAFAVASQDAWVKKWFSCLSAFEMFVYPLAYMISVKRLSILFGVIYGGVVFAEDNILIRFAGALLMFLGTALILVKAR